jgi:hypothetical protein
VEKNVDLISSSWSSSFVVGRAQHPDPVPKPMSYFQWTVGAQKRSSPSGPGKWVRDLDRWEEA